jgi:hypothetical protein
MGYEWSPINPGYTTNYYGSQDIGNMFGVKDGSNIWGMVWYDDTPPPSSPSYGQPSQYSYQVQVPYEYYQDVETVTTINGALAAQSTVLPRAGWVVQLGLYYTQIGSVGDVEVLITRCTNGVPDPLKVISRATLARADMKKYPQVTLLPIQPVMGQSGERIGVIEISQGNHFVAMGAPGYTEGNFFRGTAAGGYLQGDIAQDRKLEIYMANFASPRTEVMLQNVSLSGGINNIAIQTEQPVLDGATLTYEAQIAGIWQPITGKNLGAFAGSPDIIPLRAVFLGTADIQVGMQLGTGRITASRPTLSSTVVSAAITTPAKRYFQIDLVVPRWDAAKNTVTMEMLTGGSYATVTASSTAVVLDEAGRPGWKRLRFTFDTTSTVTSYKVKTILTRASDGKPVRRMERTSVATG